MKKLGLTALAAIAAASCATAYGPRYERASASGSYGYYDTRLEENRYRVQYRADGDAYIAQDFAMRRAAELTRSRGYDWFQVINRSRAANDDMFGRYDRYRYGADNTAQNRSRPEYGSGYQDDSVVVLDIVMGYNPPPKAANIYDAKRLQKYQSGDRQ